jgi:hypothetical protein
VLATLEAEEERKVKYEKKEIRIAVSLCHLHTTLYMKP